MVKVLGHLIASLTNKDFSLGITQGSGQELELELEEICLVEMAHTTVVVIQAEVHLMGGEIETSGDKQDHPTDTLEPHPRQETHQEGVGEEMVMVLGHTALPSVTDTTALDLGRDSCSNQDRRCIE